ncbi:hypothetical protein WJX84_000728 [Apatococcus fuscideae]|uniref:DNA (cytosine-5-)-methyltransferase n=1 Tax=Apatococcus fuscideae TaxID=2026836 RepID=A0AAW1SSZ7_9CHLO
MSRPNILNFVDGSRWTTEPLREERLADSPAGTITEQQDETAIWCFDEVELDDTPEVGKFQFIRRGDFVEVCTTILTKDFREHYWVLHVEKLYEDARGQRWVDGTWFWSAIDTCLGVSESVPRNRLPARSEGEARGWEVRRLVHPVDERRLFRASEKDNHNFGQCSRQLLTTIHRKVRVLRVQPGQRTPTEEEADFWWDFEHDRCHQNFMCPPCQPDPSRSKLDPPLMQPPQEWAVLDLYCGAGGSAYFGEGAPSTKARWAVDIQKDACSTYEANFQGVQVHHNGVDKFIMISKKWQQLLDALDGNPEVDLTTLDPSAPEDKEYESSLGPEGDLQDMPPVFEGDWSQQHEGPNDWPVARIHGCHLGTRCARRKNVKDQKREGKQPCAGEDDLEEVAIEVLSEENSFLLFEVFWVGEAVPGLLPLSRLQTCREKLLQHVEAMQRCKRIPLPADVDIITGGPPCQGVSSANRHSLEEDILRCPKNRQLLVFMEAVEWFQPAFVLMENVPEALSKENGSYGKYAATKLLNMGYQTRTALLSAAGQGAPQNRWRMFMWGAMPGHQLPAFPEPVHQHSSQYGKAATKSADLCLVTFLPEADALPPVVTADALTDLPKINNFTVAESAQYDGEVPKSAYQAVLRRKPSSAEASLVQRASFADAKMEVTHRCYQQRVEKLFTCGAEFMVGKAYGWKRGRGQLPHLLQGNRPKQVRAGKFTSEDKDPEFQVETWDATMQLLGDIRKQEAREADVRASLRQVDREVGMQVMAAYKEADQADGPLRDHRSLSLGHADRERVELIPKQKHAGFHKLPGVCVHHPGKNGRGLCCAGHSHQPRGRPSACPGGGTYDKPEAVRKRKCPGKQPTIRQLDRGGWRGPRLPGCPSSSVWLRCGELTCPRWCISGHNKNSANSQIPFGRHWWDEVQGTLTTNPFAQNNTCLHPDQPRVLSIREVARVQGFPDKHVFVGTCPRTKHNAQSHANKTVFLSWARSSALASRYMQIGNAVSPLVAAALGCCWELAMQGQSLPNEPVIRLQSSPYLLAINEARQQGLQFWVEKEGRQADVLAEVADEESAALQPGDDDNPGAGPSSEAESSLIDLTIPDSEDECSVFDLLDDTDEEPQ